MTTLRETLVNAIEALKALEHYCNMQPEAWYHASAQASIADLRAQIKALDKAEPVGFVREYALTFIKDFGYSRIRGKRDNETDIPLYTTPKPCPQCADWTRRSESCESKLGQLEAAMRDAELYRWLRSRKGLTLRSSAGVWTRPDKSTYNETYYLVADGTQYGPAETLDDTIRAAMAHEAESI